MASSFIKATTYRPKFTGMITFMDINGVETKFPSDAEVRIAVSGSGAGGGGYYAETTYEISIKNGNGENIFSEITKMVTAYQ